MKLRRRKPPLEPQPPRTVYQLERDVPDHSIALLSASIGGIAARQTDDVGRIAELHRRVDKLEQFLADADAEVKRRLSDLEDGAGS